MSALEVRNLNFYLDGRKFYGEKPLSFSLNFGEALAVLGQNGVGKTTLINLCLGFLKCKDCDIKINEKPLKNLTQKELFSTVAYVPQAKNFGVSLSVSDMVLLGLNLDISQTPKQKDLQKVENVLKYLNILKLKDKICSKLSGGELQMVILARSLVKEPKIIILDEPESNLDFKNQVKLLDILLDLKKQNVAILINTHYPKNAKILATKALFLSRDEYKICQNEDINSQNLSKFFEVKADYFAGI